MAVSSELRIVTEEMPPYNYLAADGTLTGATTEIVQALLKSLGAETPIETMPWARAYKIALNQPNVLIFSILRTHQREALFHWLGAISPVEMQIFSLPDAGIAPLSDLMELNGQTIGMVRGSSQYEFIRGHHNVDDSDLVIAGSYDQLYKMHQLGRVVLFMAPGLLVKYHNHILKTPAQQQPVSVYHIPFKHQRQLHLAFSKTTPQQTVIRFRKALMIMTQNGDITRMFTNFQSRLQLQLASVK
jgi:polar amino acid transport system substrate-binding protein